MKILAQVAPRDYETVLRFQSRLWTKSNGEIGTKLAKVICDFSHNVRGLRFIDVK